MFALAVWLFFASVLITPLSLSLITSRDRGYGACGYIIYYIAGSMLGHMLCSLHMLGSDSLRVVLDVLWSLFCNQRAKLALHVHPLQAPLNIHHRHSPSALTLFIMVLPLRPRPRQPQLRPRLRLRMRLRLRLRLQSCQHDSTHTIATYKWQILFRKIVFFSWHILLRTRNARQRELKQLCPKPPAAAGRRLSHPLPSMPADCSAAVAANRLGQG